MSYFLLKLWNPFRTLPLGSGLAVRHFTTRHPAGFIVDFLKEEKPHFAVGALPKKAAALFRSGCVTTRSRERTASKDAGVVENRRQRALLATASHAKEVFCGSDASNSEF